ncbi:DUF3293 domain-containing protein [Streptomyces avermitilis]
MDDTRASATPRNWAGYQQAVVDIRLADRTVRVVPGPQGAAEGHFPEPAGRTIHVITACNPYGRTASAEDNGRAQALLFEEIGRRRLAWWPAAGGTVCGAHIEESAALVGLSDVEARELGRHFGQDAVFAWTPDAWSLLSCSSDETAVSGWTMSTQQPRDPGSCLT